MKRVTIDWQQVCLHNEAHVMAHSRLPILLLAAAGSFSGQTRLGQKAPALHLGSVLSGTQNGPSAGLALSIEFWAAWCLLRKRLPAQKSV
jgi:hypothetical protein